MVIKVPALHLVQDALFTIEQDAQCDHQGLTGGAGPIKRGMQF